MLFSIIIPVHNGERYLAECVNSALAQDSKRTEIILVENGSTDNTPVLADNYASQYENIKCLHRGRIGLFAARQEGIKAAKGDWIVALDADDKLKENAISTLAVYLENIIVREPEISLVIYKATVLNEHGDQEVLKNGSAHGNKVYGGRNKEILYEQFCRDDSLNSMWTKCLRRDIASIEPYDIFLNYGEDLYQTATYLERAEKIAFLDENLYYYRKNEASLTASYSEVFLENQNIVWKRMDDFLLNRRNEQYNEWVRRRKALTCSILIAAIIYSGLSFSDKKKALKETFEDEFYKQYSHIELPEWAPEEDIFVHKLQMNDEPMKALLSNAIRHDVKVAFKKCLKWREVT